MAVSNKITVRDLSRIAIFAAIIAALSIPGAIRREDAGGRLPPGDGRGGGRRSKTADKRSDKHT